MLPIFYLEYHFSTFIFTAEKWKGRKCKKNLELENITCTGQYFNINHGIVKNMESKVFLKKYCFIQYLLLFTILALRYYFSIKKIKYYSVKLTVSYLNVLKL